MTNTGHTVVHSRASCAFLGTREETAVPTP
jgi:hypothetical protein